MVRTWRFHCQGFSSIPAMRCSTPCKKKKIVFLCLLDFTVLGEKSAIIYIVAPIYMASPFSLAAFKVLFLLLIFSSFDCLGPRFYFLIFRGFCI